MTREVQDFPIGTKFLSDGKVKRICTVIDILKTYNSSGELVKTSYIAEHDFLGQKVKNNDVCHTTIARNLLK